MPAIARNGHIYGGSPTTPVDAEDIVYDNLTSELDSTNVQSAIDELKGIIDEGGSGTQVQSDYAESDTTSPSFIKNKPTLGTAAALDNTTAITEGGINLPTSGAVYSALSNKVNVEIGKGLSTNDYTDTDKTKLDGIESGADVNVIESITLNGVSVQPDVNKNVALTVITETVNNLVNYYLKTDTYSKTETDTLISAIRNSRFEVVSTLPTTDIKTNVIYLVPKTISQTDNIYDEFVNLDGTVEGYEKIGDTEIDLSNYVTVSDLNTTLADYTTTTNLTVLLNGKQNKTDNALQTTDKTVVGAINEVVNAFNALGLSVVNGKLCQTYKAN